MSIRINIPNKLLKRLPKYYRYLSCSLKKEMFAVSSYDLAGGTGITPDLVRRDIFTITKPGGVGEKGYGYKVKDLYIKIGNILGIETRKNLIIIGAGYFGRVLANNDDFGEKGFNIIGIFDTDPCIVGEKINNFDVRSFCDLQDFVSKNNVDIAVLTVPDKAARKVAKMIINLGIKGIWNYSMAELKVNEDIAIENICLLDSLTILGYKLKKYSSDLTLQR